MSDEWLEFSKRLAAAMRAAGYEPRAGVLHKQFNLRYRGRSIAFQTASRWLKGEGIPQHDKLVLLAKLFKADPCALQYGDASARKGKAGLVSEDPATYEERELLNDFLALPAQQRDLVRELIRMLAAALPRQKGA